MRNQRSVMLMQFSIEFNTGFAITRLNCTSYRIADEENINYDHIDELLEYEKQKSIDFLKQALM